MDISNFISLQSLFSQNHTIERTEWTASALYTSAIVQGLDALGRLRANNHILYCMYALQQTVTYIVAVRCCNQQYMYIVEVNDLNNADHYISGCRCCHIVQYSLPDDVTSSPSLNIFRSRLKTICLDFHFLVHLYNYYCCYGFCYTLPPCLCINVS